MIPWWKVEFGEPAARAAYRAVVDRRLTMGPLTAEFERRLAEILGAPHVVSVSSGTAALTLALLAAGVGPGDEVIVPNRTWISTAHAPKLLGAEVVLAEVEPDKPLLSPAAFAAALTSRTKAVIPVHLNGHLADMESINAIAEARGVTVIEDACQAMFSCFPDGEAAGTKSFAGCLSFSIGKPISCGQRGAVITSSPETARKLILARTHGTADVTMARWEGLGGNFRFWDLPAAVALTQLDRFEERKEAVLRLRRRYEEGLAGLKRIRPLAEGPSGGEVPIYAECLGERREELLEFLAARGIQARPHYADLNTAPQFSARNPGPYPNSRLYAGEGLTLSSGPDRTEEELTAVFAALNEWEEKPL
ncbi:MAG: DegT/DnrJ/EryC1/StrS family aminotransferase, partial [Planctomycetota bacterium]|jgi:dTDP-4-amino-4,6-dideoxygalactose transaminase|nr:DegT/DnrJ/EryC1/StrS family aminotransferase [Planctomycetota bacterium]